MPQPKDKEQWEARLENELLILMDEYRMTGDKSRIVNILELVDDLLASERKKWVGEIIKYQNGFVRQVDEGVFEAAPEYEVIDKLLEHLRSIQSTNTERE